MVPVVRSICALAKQMIGLKDEADVFAPDLGELLSTESLCRVSVNPDDAASGRQHASEYGEKRGLAAA